MSLSNTKVLSAPQPIQPSAYEAVNEPTQSVLILRGQATRPGALSLTFLWSSDVAQSVPNRIENPIRVDL